MRDFHPDDDVASPEGYAPQMSPDDYDPGIPNQLLILFYALNLLK